MGQGEVKVGVPVQGCTECNNCYKNEMSFHLEELPDGRHKIMMKNHIQMDGIIQVNKIEVSGMVEVEVRGVLQWELGSRD